MGFFLQNAGHSQLGLQWHRDQICQERWTSL